MDKGHQVSADRPGHFILWERFTLLDSTVPGQEGNRGEGIKFLGSGD
jgi:hypothetical protein